MNRHYDDILKRIPEPPQWFDENAVPRFDAFAPSEVADIYAEEAVLAEISCQGCHRRFNVAFTINSMERALNKSPSLEACIRNKTLHYGDPPNMECCAAGPTMNSEPRRVIEFWRKSKAFEWVRHPDLELPIDPDWVTAEDPKP